MDSLRESEIDGFVGLDVFTACPVAMGHGPKSYLKRARDIARWSERNGCRGALVHADSRLLDPWLLSQAMIQSTRTFCPLVAVQPAHVHPFAVANTIATLSPLYGRRVFILWVARPTGDDMPHDERYDRLVEFASIVRQLTDGATVTVEGRYHDARGLALRQAVDAALRPEFIVSGSSPAGRVACQTLGARTVNYALPPEEEQNPPLENGHAAALRLGIITREDGAEAWHAAYTRFQPDRKTGLALHSVHDTAGYPVDVRRLAEERAAAGMPYWTQPFESYQAMCPYLVGSHEDVFAALSRYVQRGFTTFILDEPESETDLEHTRIVFDYARGNIMEVA